jgi:predicted membrane protein
LYSTCCHQSPRLIAFLYLVFLFYTDVHRDEHQLLAHIDIHLVIARLMVNICIVTLFAVVYFNIFIRQPHRYIAYNWRTRGGCWPWGW